MDGASFRIDSCTNSPSVEAVRTYRTYSRSYQQQLPLLNQIGQLHTIVAEGDGEQSASGIQKGLGTFLRAGRRQIMKNINNIFPPDAPTHLSHLSKSDQGQRYSLVHSLRPSANCPPLFHKRNT
ncbi:hypothetical protein [Amycolatopsis rhizosphaerae]|uniref:hypothetical protein n=1 Tax=Amycolatopsis rhizosphaerae TaxID=2053003 RepID=UPI001643AE1F|nr:hypothetical protein [Amycolatopsis rhizosphaerae]